jgi:hypothetical protein
MNYIRYPMTSEQLRDTLKWWANEDKIILMDNEIVHFLGEASQGLMLKTEALNLLYYFDVQNNKVQGVSDDKGNWVGYYVPDVTRGKYHLIRSIINVTEEMMYSIENYKNPHE